MNVKVTNCRNFFRHLDEYNVLGFDCEWISKYRRYPVALLQLSSNRGLCALIRLCKLKMIPEELQVRFILCFLFTNVFYVVL